MRSPINKKNWSGWSLPAWWGRWHQGPHPSQEGLTGPQRCIQHRHRRSPVRWEDKTIWIQHSNQLFLDQGWVDGICMQVDMLKLYDTELKLFGSAFQSNWSPPGMGQQDLHIGDQGTFRRSGQSVAWQDWRWEGIRLGFMTHFWNDYSRHLLNNQKEHLTIQQRRLHPQFVVGPQKPIQKRWSRKSFLGWASFACEKGKS